MKITYNSEMVAGLIFTVVATVLYLLVPIQIHTLETTQINAQTIPRIALGGLGLFSFLLFLQGVFLCPKKILGFDEKLYASRDFRDAIRSTIYIAIIVVYVVLFSLLGFIASSVYLIFAVLLYYRSTKKSHYIVAFSISAIVYFVFTVILNISLP